MRFRSPGVVSQPAGTVVQVRLSGGGGAARVGAGAGAIRDRKKRRCPRNGPHRYVVEPAGSCSNASCCKLNGYLSCLQMHNGNPGTWCVAASSFGGRQKSRLSWYSLLLEGAKGGGDFRCATFGIVALFHPPLLILLRARNRGLRFYM